MNITTLKEYTPETAQRVRELLIQLSRSGKDKGEIPEEWFKDLIASPFRHYGSWHQKECLPRRFRHRQHYPW